MAVKRKNRLSIVNDVRRACSKMRYDITTNRIVTYTDINWETVKLTLDTLEMLDIINKDLDNPKKYVYRGLISDIDVAYDKLIKKYDKLNTEHILLKNVIKKCVEK